MRVFVARPCGSWPTSAAPCAPRSSGCGSRPSCSSSARGRTRPASCTASYLAQSDVFVGIYGDSYGWVAPERAGLGARGRVRPRAADDAEAHLHQERAEHREERLNELIARIRATTPPRTCRSRRPTSWQSAVAADLATLLAERFDAVARARRPPTPDRGVPRRARAGPVHDDDRPRARHRRRASSCSPAATTGVVSLIGPGGIGKSRLAIEVAHAARGPVPRRHVLRAAWSTCSSPALLLPTIAYALGIRDNGEAALEERIAHALAGRRVLHRARQLRADRRMPRPSLVRLYTVAPTASFLVTSRDRAAHPRRAGLRRRALPTPAHGAGPAAWSELARSAAVPLFVDRAQAAKPGFDAHRRERRRDVADICRRLEGPAARDRARRREGAPAHAGGIAQRLERSLPLLTAAVRDLPDGTARCARRSSGASSLLPAGSDRDLLEDLGVFAERFTLDAVEAIGAGRSWDGHALDGITALIDGVAGEADRGRWPLRASRFWRSCASTRSGASRSAARPI